MTEDCKQSKLYKDVCADTSNNLKDIYPPTEFKPSEWRMLTYADKLEFVRKKKAYVLTALQNRMTSPVVSLMLDLVDLESKMAHQDSIDAEGGVAISKEYLEALRLKVQLANTLKALTDKGVITHEHIVRRMTDDKEVIDADFEDMLPEIVRKSKKTVEVSEVGSVDKPKDE